MPLTLSQIAKPAVQNAFLTMGRILDLSKTHCDDKDIDIEQLLSQRLVADMASMKWQLQMITEFSARTMTRLADGDIPAYPFEASDDLDNLKARLEEIWTYIDGLDTAAMDAAEDRMITIPMGPERSMDMSGKDFLLKMIIPNLLFHTTTMYNIARANGVQIGKMDFMSHV